ncbi:unnamed protein product [Didymodactylos carnosus]|uniref:Uncharacterized protein n=1 Tax=Didymodactylos carnosus TaxID=1234261 RepID=A0A816BE84_9BILA|nr:unnamed protein product [Didymodactylos carnosus]CAF1608023.1 unnamed protein product [Didymodactylos carnosus]CAF4359765.1 unnamed protein product [Didymodactylos carnosus]CAF4489031.1 unnamed protein product [Didymodactylos carnosus]
MLLQALHNPISASYYDMAMKQQSMQRAEWYGSDFKFKWLFSTSFKSYNIMMDRHFYFQYYAALRHPNVEAILWGRGFKG